MTPKRENGPTAKGPNKTQKGDGTAPYQRKADGMWCMAIDLAKRDDGKRRRKVVVAKTEGAVKLKMKEQKRKLLKEGDLSTSNVTVATWMNLWFNTIALKKIKPRTASSYRTQINQYVIPTIGKVRLDKLTPAHIRRVHDFITSKPKNPADPSKGFLSSTTALNTHRMLVVALNYAEREGRVTKNPAKLTDAPRKAVAHVGVMTAADGVKTLQAVARDRLGSRWATALLTGARQGEVIGLEIDRVTDVLDLSWQLQRITWEHGCDGTCSAKAAGWCPQKRLVTPEGMDCRVLSGRLMLVPPKSGEPRTFPLPQPLLELLERHVADLSMQPNPHGLLWPAANGSPMTGRDDQAEWKALLVAAGVENKDATTHWARHTAISDMAALAVPDRTIGDMVGHRSAGVTGNYTHLSSQDSLEAMTKLGERRQVRALSE